MPLELPPCEVFAGRGGEKVCVCGQGGIEGTGFRAHETAPRPGGVCNQGAGGVKFHNYSTSVCVCAG